MEQTKWNFKIFNHYLRLTLENRFIILGKREGQWKEITFKQF